MQFLAVSAAALLSVALAQEAAESTVPRCLNLTEGQDRFLMLGAVGNTLAGWTERAVGNYTFDIAMPGICPVAVDVVDNEVLEVFLDGEYPSFWPTVVGEEANLTSCENLPEDFDNWGVFTIDHILMEMLMNVRDANATHACWETSKTNNTYSAFMHVDFEDENGRDDITAVVWNLKPLTPQETAELITSYEAAAAAREGATDGTRRLLRPASERRLFGGARRVGRRAGRRSRTVVGGAVRGATRGAIRGAVVGASLAGAAVGARAGARSSFRNNYVWGRPYYWG
uniref:Uncharacterized protein n=1 Tax=Chromera velia CCMP2878 TaxID=1169474 RepID=A0A0G4EYU4_9ALVE|eukprot:Cvel_14327.t1-p1 / transcript=Cvel_14327.t1 / gene=Cvel_14327 / organism=Chromera_velia_CCMP2878 / gene_product=hypothetical protein / transcript_product=hypothetical protein / location=Cvel_scaffold1014:32868-33862(+) / protein_length=284 / sequence_SO=supercontig / SO=protein_coding / is_pseudo=false